MKIVVVTNLYPPDVLGGYELGCKQAVEALRAAGHQVDVLTGNARSSVPTEPGLFRSLKITDIYDRYVSQVLPDAVKGVRAMEAYSFSAFNVHAFTQHLEANRPDIVYFWNLTGLGGIGLIAAAQQMGLPWLMHVMDMVPQMLAGIGRLRPANPAIGRAFAEGVRGRFLCCSETVLKEMEFCDLPVRGVSTVMPNWVVSDGLRDRTDYMPQGKLRIVSAGRYSKEKGTDLLIEAAGMLRDRGHTNFVLDLYGFGDYGTFQTMILERNLSENVRLLGSRTQDQLLALYSQYDLFAFPTWAREPFGFAPLEAATFGCVPVVARECGYSEFAQDGVHCVKADRNARAFTDAFEMAFTGKLDLAKLGRTAANATLDEFHLRTLLPRIEAELSATIRTHRPGKVRTAGQAYQTAIFTEKVVLALLQTQRVYGEVGAVALPTENYDFFENLPVAGKANIVLGPIRRLARKILIPIFQRARDLLLHLDAQTRDHRNRISHLESLIAHQQRQLESLAIQQFSTQRQLDFKDAEPRRLHRAA